MENMADFSTPWFAKVLFSTLKFFKVLQMPVF